MAHTIFKAVGAMVVGAVVAAAGGGGCSPRPDGATAMSVRWRGRVSLGSGLPGCGCFGVREKGAPFPPGPSAQLQVPPSRNSIYYSNLFDVCIRRNPTDPSVG